jgi:uncharacterized membrane protein
MTDQQRPNTHRVVISAIIAALYIVLTFAFNPISFGPLQFRVANVLMALMLFDVDFCFGLALGIFIGNLGSPFGPLDWLVMPLVSLAAALLAYTLRRFWYVGLVIWSLITAAGVAFFPLFLGGHIPFVATFPFILVSQVVIGFLGYSIWKPFRQLLEAHAHS